MDATDPETVKIQVERYCEYAYPTNELYIFL